MATKIVQSMWEQAYCAAHLQQSIREACEIRVFYEFSCRVDCFPDYCTLCPFRKVFAVPYYFMLPRDRPETHSAHILSDNQFHEHLYLVPLVHENISLFSVVIASI